MTAAKKRNHICDLFSVRPEMTSEINMNCGVCEHFNQFPPSPVHRVCLIHDELIQYHREHPSNWQQKQLV